MGRTAEQMADCVHVLRITGLGHIFAGGGVYFPAGNTGFEDRFSRFDSPIDGVKSMLNIVGTEPSPLSCISPIYISDADRCSAS
jgi:hypothetical protein